MRLLCFVLGHRWLGWHPRIGWPNRYEQDRHYGKTQWRHCMRCARCEYR
jgi:hypothetical protein